jgi:hypothetical protein
MSDLIERLHARARQVEDEEFWEKTLEWEAAARLAELEAAAKTPLSDEVAGLIERAKERVVYHDRVAATISNLGKPRTDNDAGRTSQLIEDLAAALEQMARHNEELIQGWSAQTTRAEAAEFRIAELEAERDCVNMLLFCVEEGGKRTDEQPAQYLRRLIDALIYAQRERDAIEAATIEKCLNIACQYESEDSTEIFNRLRALAKPPASV